MSDFSTSLRRRGKEVPKSPSLSPEHKVLPSRPTVSDPTQTVSPDEFKSPKTIRSRWDYLMPAFATLQIPLTLLGPIYIPRFYLYYIAFWFIFAAFEYPFQAFKAIAFSLRVAKKAKESFTPTPLNYTHVIVLPNYNESTSLLHNTLSRLASHTFAREAYVVVLGMEEAEKGGIQKGYKLKRAFEHRFADILVTCHPANVKDENPGKASNVNYAVRVADRVFTTPDIQDLVLPEHTLMRKGPAIRSSSIVITIADSDSHIPERYISEVDSARTTQGSVCKYGFYEPPMWFARNLDSVPALVRAADSIWSMFVMTNLNNPRGVKFPCSTYSLTLDLARAVGYWDSDSHSIAEDIHMFIKCYTQTSGMARATPIHVPIFVMNVEADGYWATMKARYTQAVRHFSGTPDIGYMLSWLAGLKQPGIQATGKASKQSNLTPTKGSTIYLGGKVFQESDSAVDFTLSRKSRSDYAEFVSSDSSSSPVTSLSNDSSDDLLDEDSSSSCPTTMGSFELDGSGQCLLPPTSMVRRRTTSYRAGTKGASTSDIWVFTWLCLQVYLMPALSVGLFFATWYPPLVSSFFPHNPSLYTFVTWLNASTVLSQLLLIVTHEWLHTVMTMTYPDTVKRKWRYLMDWTLLPISALVYVTIPINVAMIQEFIRRRKTGSQSNVNYVVAEKGALRRPTSPTAHITVDPVR